MDKWLIWCNLNMEQQMLKKTFGELCVSIDGSTPMDEKIRLEKLWRKGNVPIMISKPSVFGYGLNWQHCNKIAFVGLSDSFEEYYQAVRRCWRFGQEKQVDVYVITAQSEGAVVDNIKRKERDFESMLSGMISATQELTKENLRGTERDESDYSPTKKTVIPKWLTDG